MLCKNEVYTTVLCCNFVLLSLSPSHTFAIIGIVISYSSIRLEKTNFDNSH